MSKLVHVSLFLWDIYFKNINVKLNCCQNKNSLIWSFYINFLKLFFLTSFILVIKFVLCLLGIGGVGWCISDESDDFYEFTPEDYYRLMATKKEGKTYMHLQT